MLQTQPALEQQVITAVDATSVDFLSEIAIPTYWTASTSHLSTSLNSNKPSFPLSPSLAPMNKNRAHPPLDSDSDSDEEEIEESFINNADGDIPASISSISNQSNNSHNVISSTSENMDLEKVFRENLSEERHPWTLLQVRSSIRRKIFPAMKFTNDTYLRNVKIKEHNNVLDILLKDLNRENDDNVKRAKFWLAYQCEIKQVLTTKKTEISSQIKDTVLKGLDMIPLNV